VEIESIPPLAMSGARHVIAGGLFALGLRARGIRLPWREAWLGHALLGLLMIGIGNGCLVWAQQFIPSGVAAVLVSVIPFWMIGVEALMPGGEPIRLRQVVGLLLGFGGIFLLASSSLQTNIASPLRIILGVIMTQMSCLGWAIGSAYAKRHKREDNLFAATALQIVSGGAVLLVVSVVTGDWAAAVHPTPRSLVAVLYLVVVGTFVGYLSYVYALKHLPVSIVSLYAYVNPVIAAFGLDCESRSRRRWRSRRLFCGMLIVRAPIHRVVSEHLPWMRRFAHGMLSMKSSSAILSRCPTTCTRSLSAL
jgi:drug/metabolite transporter (DMT)-like permease